MLLDDSTLPKAKVDERLMQKCVGVVDIPAADMVEAVATPLWAQDRRHLGSCARMHNALVDTVRVLEK